MKKSEISIIGYTIFKNLESLNIELLDISDYNKNYLNKYLNNYSFYNNLYTQLFQKVINKLNKPINESTFIDYGGGCGILSFMAKKIGFKKVVFNDLYNVSVEDTKLISQELKIDIDKFICGNIDKVVSYIRTERITLDAICSFDVLEHIYNLENWFNKLSEIDSAFVLVFMTSANPKNPYINSRLKRLHYNAEIIGFEKTKGWKKTDLSEPYFKVRTEIISEYNIHLTSEEVDFIAKQTRGLRIDDIKKTIDYYISNNKINYAINHPTNTCDPYTGNWSEHLIDLNYLRNIASKISPDVEFTNTLYSYSKNKVYNLPKYFLNIILKILGKNNLLFSHTYTLEIK